MSETKDQSIENNNQSEEKHLIEMFQCTKEQYNNRENLTPKKLTPKKLTGEKSD